MKFTRILAISIVSFIFFSFMVTDNSTNTIKNKKMKIENNKVLRHIVLFKFKEGTATEKIEKVEAEFKKLQSKIPQIQSFEWGLNNSPEGLDKGFTHCFFVTFVSEADREIYLPHPDHQAFVKLLDGILDDVLVVDYWTK